MTSEFFAIPRMLLFLDLTHTSVLTLAVLDSLLDSIFLNDYIYSLSKIHEVKNCTYVNLMIFIECYVQLFRLKVARAQKIGLKSTYLKI